MPSELLSTRSSPEGLGEKSFEIDKRFVPRFARQIFHLHGTLHLEIPGGLSFRRSRKRVENQTLC